jgi:AraC-like DNA-binding protein
MRIAPFKLNSIYFLLISLPLFVFIVAFYIVEPHKTLTITPNTSNNLYKVYSYSDTVYSPILSYSKSNIIINHTDSIVFEYELQKNNTTPYAGITLLSQNNTLLNINEFDFIEIDIAGTITKRPQMLLGINSIFKKDNNYLKKYIVKDLDLNQKQKKYTLSLDDFYTPSWWYLKENIKEEEVSNYSFDKLASINIQNCQLIPNGVKDKITLYSIRFTKNIYIFYGYLLSFGIVYYLFLLLLIRKRKTISLSETIEIQYTPVNMVNKSVNDLENLVSYISVNYSNPELSLSNIQIDLGLQSSKVSLLLKDKYQLNFKQYLNKLRINEAKRLLKDVNEPISDIAYKVGYGHISHFNRVFKETVGISPKDYRKGKMNKI